MSNFNMKRLAGALGAALLLAAAGGYAIAGVAAPQKTPASSASQAPTPTAQQQNQAAFYRNMQTMRAQMMQWRTSRDPATRSKLLDEHMRTMQNTLHMMMGQQGPRGPGNMAAGNMGNGMMGNGGMGPGMMRGSGMGGGMMGNGQMMQMMMGQMMQHQQAMQGMNCTR